MRRSPIGWASWFLMIVAVGACAAPAADDGDEAGRPAAAAPTTTDAPAPRNEIGRFVAPLDTLDSWTVVDPQAVNLEVERAWKVGLEWPRRAYDVAMAAVGELEGRSIVVRLEREGVEGPAATVVVTAVGFADDSVGGVRHDLDLALQLDGSWRVVTHWRSLFCPRGPGRGAWVAGPCH